MWQVGEDANEYIKIVFFGKNYMKDKHRKLVKCLATTAYRFAEMNGLDMSYARIYTMEIAE